MAGGFTRFINGLLRKCGKHDDPKEDKPDQPQASRAPTTAPTSYSTAPSTASSVLSARDMEPQGVGNEPGPVPVRPSLPAGSLFRRLRRSKDVHTITVLQDETVERPLTAAITEFFEDPVVADRAPSIETAEQLTRSAVQFLHNYNVARAAGIDPQLEALSGAVSLATRLPAALQQEGVALATVARWMDVQARERPVDVRMRVNGHRNTHSYETLAGQLLREAEAYLQQHQRRPRTRDSTNADIETNPGPSFGFKPLAKAVQKLGTSILIRVSDNYNLQLKLKPVESEADDPPDDSVFVQKIPVGEVKYAGYRGARTTAKQLMKKAACRSASGHSGHLRVATGAHTDRTAPYHGFFHHQLLSIVSSFLCPDTIDRQDELSFFICGERRRPAANPMLPLLRLTDRTVRTRVCDNDDHDYDAVDAWVRSLPRFMRGSGGFLPVREINDIGNGDLSCPLCWPDGMMVSPGHSLDLGMTTEQRMSFAELVARWVNMLEALPVRGHVAYVIVSSADIPDLRAATQAGFNIVLVCEENHEHEWTQAYHRIVLHQHEMIFVFALMRYMPGLLGRAERYLVITDYLVNRLDTGILAAPRGTWELLSRDAIVHLGSLVDPSRDLWATQGGLFIAMRYRFAMRIYNAWTETLPCNTMFMAGSNAPSSKSYDFLADGHPLAQFTGSFWGVGQDAMYTGSGPLEYVYLSAHRRVVQLSASQSGSFYMVARALTSRWNPDHAGTYRRVSFEQAAMHPPVTTVCSCFQCWMRGRYGVVRICLAGTTGDRLPFEALGRVLTIWGLDVLGVEMLPLEEGVEYLRDIQLNGVFRGAPGYMAAVARFGTLGGVTVGPTESRPAIVWSISPPTTYRHGLNFGFGPILNSIFNNMIGDEDTQPRVAAYRGVLNLPRSHDGVNFLPHPPPSGKRDIDVIYAMGSSGFLVPPGAHTVQPGDHIAQFSRARAGVCHGGAGTVQTMAACGIRPVVAADSTLDRDYYDPLDAGAGVWAGANPNKVVLLLLGHDFAPLVFAFRGGLRLGFDALWWYCRLYFFADLAFLVSLARLTPALTLQPAPLELVVSTVFVNYTTSSWLAPLYALFCYVIGTALLSLADVTPVGLLMRLLRLARRASRSRNTYVISALFGTRYGLAFEWLSGTLIPAAAATIRILTSGKHEYLSFYWVFGFPVHVVIENEDASLQYEGAFFAAARGREYKLTRVTRPLDTRAFRIPISRITPLLDDVPHSGMDYIFVTNNCQTAIISAFSEPLAVFGLGGILLFGAYLLALLSGITGMAVLFCVGVISVFFTLIGAGDEDNHFTHFTHLVLANERSLAILEHAMPSRSLSRFLIRAGRVLTNLGAPSPLDQAFLDAYDEVEPLLSRLSTIPEKVDQITAIGEILERQPFIDATLPRLGVLIRLLNKFGVADAEPLVCTAADPSAVEFLRAYSAVLVEAHALQDHKISLADYNRLRRGGDAWKYVFPRLYRLFELWPDEEDEISESLELAVASVYSIMNVGEVLDHVHHHEYGTIDAPNVLPDVWSDMTIVESIYARHVFFRLTEEPGESDLLIDDVLPYVEEGPTDQEVAFLGAATAIGLAVGADEVTAVTNAVLESREVIQGPEVPYQGAKEHFEASVKNMYEASKPITTVLDFFNTNLIRFRLWLRLRHDTNITLAPLEAFFSFCGMVFSYLSIGLTRVIGTILSLGTGPDDRAAAWLHQFLMKAVFFLQMLNPAHRTSPKPVWALLWKWRRANVTKTEQMLFSLSEASYEKPASYASWVDQMAALMNIPGVDTTILSRQPPERILFRPKDPVGVSEYEDIDALEDVYFKETPEARRFMDESLAAGNPLTIDGSWLARPESTARSLARYEVPRPTVSHSGVVALQMAAKALFDHYRPLYERPLPMTPRAVANLSKWKYSAGLPFLPIIRKREALRHSQWFDAIVTAAERILKTGKMPAVGMHGFAKNYVNSVETLLNDPLKLRTVTAGDRITFTAVNALLMERNKRVGRTEDGLLNMMRRTEGGILSLKEHYDRFPHRYADDGRAFDSTVVKEVATVGSVELFRLGFEQFGVYNTKAAVSVVKAYYEALTEGLIVDLMSGKVVWKTGGGGTGSAATTPDNRDWTRLVWVAGWCLTTGRPAKEFFDHFFFTNASDDVFFTTDDYGESVLPEILVTMKDNYGVQFASRKRDQITDILHLVHVPFEDLDCDLYASLGMEPPKDGGLRHDPQRLLFTRSAFRADRMRFNPIVAAAHIAERSTGYQLLTAHSPDMYDLVTRDLVDALLSVAKPLWGDRTYAELTLSDTGLVIDGTIFIPQLDADKPTHSLRSGAAKYLRRNPGKTLEDYVLMRRKQAIMFIKQRTGKSYKQVFEAWVKPPPPQTATKAAKRYAKYNKATTTLGPLSDLVRLGLFRSMRFLDSLPKMLLTTTPELVAIPANRPFTTWDFTIETYIWRREYNRTHEIPTYSRLERLIRESPFAAATDLGAFMAMLASEGMLEAQIRLAEGRPVRETLSLVSGLPLKPSTSHNVLVWSVGARRGDFLRTLEPVQEMPGTRAGRGPNNRVWFVNDQLPASYDDAWLCARSDEMFAFYSRYPRTTQIITHRNHARCDRRYVAAMVAPSDRLIAETHDRPHASGTRMIDQDYRRWSRDGLLQSRGGAPLLWAPARSERPFEVFCAELADVVERENSWAGGLAMSALSKRGFWLLSNDAVMGRVLAFLAWYTAMDLFVRHLQTYVIFGTFVIAVFGGYRLMEVFYSAQSLLYWVSAGAASLVISNAMPRDKYVLQKQLASVLAACTPSFLTDYWFGIYAVLGKLAQWVEIGTFIPFLLNYTNDQMATDAIQEADDTWDVTVRMFEFDKPSFVIGGTGTGKSTAFIAGLLHADRAVRVVLLQPTNRLVDLYQSRHYNPAWVVKVYRGDHFDMLTPWRVLVMTPGQYRLRQDILANVPHQLIIDEAHVSDGPQLDALAVALASPMANPVCMTATPLGPLYQYALSHDWTVHTVPPRRRAVRLPDEFVDSFEDAVRRLPNDIDLTTTAWYHPSIRTLETWAATLSGREQDYKMITSNAKPSTRRAMTFMTGVVLAGANLEPAPAILYAEPVKMRKRGTTSPTLAESGGVATLERTLGLASAPLAAHEREQLGGRIARTRTGKVIWIGTSEPGEYYCDVDLSSLGRLTPALREQVWAACRVHEAFKRPFSAILDDLFSREPDQPIPRHYASSGMFLLCMSLGLDLATTNGVLSIGLASGSTELHQVRDEILRLLPQDLVALVHVSSVDVAFEQVRRCWYTRHPSGAVRHCVPIVASGQIASLLL